MKKVEKQKLHPRNKHQGRYDFDKLINHHAELSDFVHKNKYGKQTIDFANAEAIKCLNRAILICDYRIKQWDIPEGYLCPPIPGRADYIHYVADLLEREGQLQKSRNKKIHCLDIGVGTSCIYPILAVAEYDWNMVGSDTDKRAVLSARGIVEANPGLKGKINIRLQQNARRIFEGILKEDDYFDLVICNPPFHESMKEAREGTLRKLSNLNKTKVTKASLNFGGQYNELCYDGGEEQFIRNMIYGSKEHAGSLGWITSLVSQESKLKSITKILKKTKAKNVQVIPMGQGNKKSRILAWRF